MWCISGPKHKTVLITYHTVVCLGPDEDDLIKVKMLSNHGLTLFIYLFISLLFYFVCKLFIVVYDLHCLMFSIQVKLIPYSD